MFQVLQWNSKHKLRASLPKVKKVAEILFANQCISQRSTVQWEDRTSHSEQMAPPTNACPILVWIEKNLLQTSSGELQNKSSCHLMNIPNVWNAINLPQWLITEKVYTCHLWTAKEGIAISLSTMVNYRESVYLPSNEQLNCELQ